MGEVFGDDAVAPALIGIPAVDDMSKRLLRGRNRIDENDGAN